MKLLNKSDEKISFKADIPISLANAIRRSVNYIPVMAIDNLEITKNDSALFDEIIAHRAGLIPLKNEKLKLASECDCKKEEGCGKCSMKFKFSMKGPGVAYSTELNPKDNNIYKMPITILDKEQELEFVATAKSGLGVEHAKFIPGLIFYRYSEDLEKDDDKGFKEIIEESKKNESKELAIFVESWGQIKAKEIFTEAIDALRKELKELAKELK